MTKDQAAAAWREIEPELADRLGDVRPKLKNYEAFMIMQKARNAVISAFPETNDTDVLRAAALIAFVGLPYMKTSKYFVAPLTQAEARLS